MSWGIVQGVAGLAQGPESKESLELAMSGLDKQMEEMKAQGMDSWESTIEKLKNMVIVLNDNFYAVQTLTLLIYALGIFAVIVMLRGVKLGFHAYVIYSLLSICDYYFFISPAMVPTFIVVLSAILSAVFIGLYAMHLKWMR
jgi:hypothetical protein